MTDSTTQQRDTPQGVCSQLAETQANLPLKLSAHDRDMLRLAARLLTEYDKYRKVT